MDRQTLLQHLAEAEHHLVLSDKHIVRQIDIIDWLKQAQCSTDLALDVLATYQSLRATHKAHYDMICRELDELKK
jgi:hypothetical protein